MVSPVSAGGGFTRTGIGTIVDMESLEVEVDVSESFISRVETGQARGDHVERLSGPAHGGPRRRDHPDGRSRKGHGQGARRVRASATPASCRRWACASRSSATNNNSGSPMANIVSIRES